uniref:Uncharacterized protein n=1 Tax=Periophthalmus magnuspinnatus TaxID=409849 RepID=A0A3B4BHF5_9GOBI
MFDNMFIPKTQQNKEWKLEKGSTAMFDAIVEHLKEKENPFDLETELKKLSEDSDGDDLSFIKEMINGPDKEGHYKGRPSNKSFLYEIVANKRTGIDVDKFDYFARDCHHLGIKNSFDHNRYIKFARVLEVDKQRVLKEDKQWQICTRIRDALLKADPVLKMSEAIKDIADKTMEEYTQLTDSIFEKILYSTGDELKEAREILQNILSRKLYRFLGETKLTDGFAKEVCFYIQPLQSDTLIAQKSFYEWCRRKNLHFSPVTLFQLLLFFSNHSSTYLQTILIIICIFFKHLSF